MTITFICFDERKVKDKLDKTQELVEEIGVDASENLVSEAGLFDQILQQFHRFDEDIGTIGK